MGIRSGRLYDRIGCWAAVISCLVAEDSSLCRAEEPKSPTYSSLQLLPQPRVIYQTDFARGFEYSVPHRNNTSREAAVVQDGVLAVTVKPGMHGASSDAPNHERAEYSHSAPLNSLVRQSFRIRVDLDFEAPKRTLVAQIKPDPISPRSPPLALYVDKGGSIKWVEYPHADAEQKQHHLELNDFGIDILDGRWHAVSMEYLRSSQDGFCRVVIDRIVVLEQRGYCSNPGGDKLNARIGIYRDAMPIEQRVYFDDWQVEVLAE